MRAFPAGGCVWVWQDGCFDFEFAAIVKFATTLQNSNLPASKSDEDTKLEVACELKSDASELTSLGSYSCGGLSDALRLTPDTSLALSSFSASLAAL